MLHSGRELFLADASLFVDDAEAYDSYVREDEPDVVEASGSTQQVRTSGTMTSLVTSRSANAVVAVLLDGVSWSICLWTGIRCRVVWSSGRRCLYSCVG